MYYTNIANKDLLPFKKTLLSNLSISLGETLNNDLFYTETLGDFLKIIPLFNTEKITSSNRLDRILENKCVIAQNTPNTILTFTTNDEDETQEYVPYGEYYSIGDELTTDQFNGIVQLIRNNIQNNETLILKQGLTNGTYADYEINIDDATIVDNGILITEETLQNINTIKVNNPKFYYSRYILTLTVEEYVTPGIGDNTRPETTIETLEVNLPVEETTILPFDELTVGSVIRFESEIKIDHSTPYIAGWVVDHVNMLPVGPISSGEVGALQAKVKDRNDIGVMGMEVSFYEEYILSIICKLSPLIIKKDDTCVVSAELRDSKDGSHVALAGETVLFYLSKGYYPLLDEAAVSCESTGANYCYSVGLDDLGLDLSSTDFKLEFDYKNTVNGGRLCIGAMDSWSSGAVAGNNYLYIGTSAANNGGYGVKYNGSTSNTSIGPVSAGNVLHCIIIRQDSTVSYYIDGELKGTKTAEWISDVTDWSIYLQCWGTGDYTVENLSLDLEPDLSNISLSVSSDRDVLSYYDEEDCTLTATVLDDGDNPLVGETVSMRVYQGSTFVDTLTVTDNEDGTYTATYDSAGIGDISIVVECRNLQETYELEDCKYYNDGSSINGLEIDTNVSCTSNGEYITITTSSSGEKNVKIPIALTGDWEFRTTLADYGVTNSLTFKVGTGSQWGTVVTGDTGLLIDLGTGSTTYNHSINPNDILKVRYINGTMSVYWNNDFIVSREVSVTGKMGYYTNTGRVQKIKNIKLKPL